MLRQIKASVLKKPLYLGTPESSERDNVNTKDMYNNGIETLAL